MSRTSFITRPVASRSAWARNRISEWSDRHFKWLLVVPGIALILALSVYPLLFSLWVVFVNYDFQGSALCWWP
jgi:ABC-type sugar transport system permease subunit